MILNTKSGLSRFLGILTLIICIGFLGCSSLQTKPTCKTLKSGSIDFYNYSYKTNPYAKVWVCKVLPNGNLDCREPFWLTKYHIWFRVEAGTYHIEVLSRTTARTVEIYVGQCKTVKVEFK